jgi:hypothetical protein
VLSIDKQLPVTSGIEYITHPPKKEQDIDRERILRLRRAKVSFLWGHISEGLTAVTNL